MSVRFVSILQRLFSLRFGIIKRLRLISLWHWTYAFTCFRNIWRKVTTVLLTFTQILFVTVASVCRPLHQLFLQLSPAPLCFRHISHASVSIAVTENLLHQADENDFPFFLYRHVTRNLVRYNIQKCIVLVIRNFELQSTPSVNFSETYYLKYTLQNMRKSQNNISLAKSFSIRHCLVDSLSHSLPIRSTKNKPWLPSCG